MGKHHPPTKTPLEILENVLSKIQQNEVEDDCGGEWIRTKGGAPILTTKDLEVISCLLSQLTTDNKSLKERVELYEKYLSKCVGKTPPCKYLDCD